MSTQEDSLRRDARRVISVFAGSAVPPPVLDYVFASVTRVSGGAQRKGPVNAMSPPTPPKYTLRRCDSGPLGEPSLLELAAVGHRRRNSGDDFASGPLQFSWTESSPVTSPPHSAKRR
ncbi:hypothetical protein HYH02_012647 [Chlamydomonas schloesseri]|uniref:Uncharacterized protein n=1 Tax=Chlamydomonas schloesseri TaxID=2026947 RepID=A0A835W1I1_9CHLO|nr:hypothetical protein HYH02_012647 [Chlamydomonas schloesseri]|eukprot:KAG2433529.1 hypothetical protein HYH02_012647 [Chlamydomonas schloesseri]